MNAEQSDKPLRLEDFGAVYGPVSAEQRIKNREALEQALAVRPYRTIELAGTIEV